MKITLSLSRLTKLAPRLKLSRILVAAAGLALVVIVVLAQSGASQEADMGDYRDQLKSQVDTATGEPRDGRDPSSQQQGSLASAASNPTGAGQRIDKPASGIQGGDKKYASSYTGQASGNGLNSSGCYIDYGTAGQCVPAHAATNGVLTCDGVRTHGGFPNGVKVSGTDRFQLDKNGDGTACGAGD